MFLLEFQTVYVSISQQTVFVGGMDPNTENVPVKVLDCDTISQVKEKALDTIYRATPYSQRPRKDDLDLGRRHNCSLYVKIFLISIESNLSHCTVDGMLQNGEPAHPVD